MEEFKNTLNHMLRFHRRRRFFPTSSFVNIEIANTGKEMLFIATNKGLGISMYYPSVDGCDDRLKILYMNK
jgi:hypothetical protein